ncbi:hypothetical protein [Candidatus Halobonum tyrrellensis]|uniref:Uncharacterized protein n=1 Tax=Candidatus Halobonum tyrrellensis G22 TaxID=1324957 RepID=V4HBG1_9EURY|nr:hypothetical protein [Candidatus Halobonum tyrrellensis]ESP88050.1 hypothetical protein K933_10879 [Candidatus Halobonum tyrrellensis G22]
MDAFLTDFLRVRAETTVDELETLRIGFVKRFDAEARVAGEQRCVSGERECRSVEGDVTDVLGEFNGVLDTSGC